MGQGREEWSKKFSKLSKGLTSKLMGEIGSGVQGGPCNN